MWLNLQQPSTTIDRWHLKSPKLNQTETPWDNWNIWYQLAHTYRIVVCLALPSPCMHATALYGCVWKLGCHKPMGFPGFPIMKMSNVLISWGIPGFRHPNIGSPEFLPTSLRGCCPGPHRPSAGWRPVTVLHQLWSEPPSVSARYAVDTLGGSFVDIVISHDTWISHDTVPNC